MRHPFAAGSINPGANVATGYTLDPFGSPPRLFVRRVRESNGRMEEAARSVRMNDEYWTLAMREQEKRRA